MHSFTLQTLSWGFIFQSPYKIWLNKTLDVPNIYHRKCDLELVQNLPKIFFCFRPFKREPLFVSILKREPIFVSVLLRDPPLLMQIIIYSNGLEF